MADGDKMYVKSDDTIPMGESYNIYKYFAINGSIAASGNIMSLLNFSDTLPSFAFLRLFNICKALTSTPELPATKLGEACYFSMFYSCTSLVKAPTILPATTLVKNCYSRMFNNCKALTSAPELPATTLVESCYALMFYNCQSLTTAPELPATTLAEYCYDGMFSQCYELTTAPELPALELTERCYQKMFYYCKKLNYVKAMFTSIAYASLTNWLDNVSTAGTFVKNANATWTNTDAGIPTGWTVQTV